MEPNASITGIQLPVDATPRDYQRYEALRLSQTTPITMATASQPFLQLIRTDAGFEAWEAQDFTNELRHIHEQMTAVVEEEQQRSAIISGVTFSAATGLLIWSLRASSLLLTLMSMLPLWRGMDPLPILDEVNKRKKELERQRKDRKREDKNTKEVGYLFDNIKTKDGE